jgi:hypothetical protein
MIPGLRGRTTYSEMGIYVRIRRPLCFENGRPPPLGEMGYLPKDTIHSPYRLAVMSHTAERRKLGERGLRLKPRWLDVPNYRADGQSPRQARVRATYYAGSHRSSCLKWTAHAGPSMPSSRISGAHTPRERSSGLQKSPASPRFRPRSCRERQAYPVAAIRHMTVKMVEQYSQTSLAASGRPIPYVQISFEIVRHLK